MELFVKSCCWVDPELLVDEIISKQQENQYVGWLDSSRKSSPYSKMSILSAHPACIMSYSTLHKELRTKYRHGKETTVKLENSFFDRVSDILNECQHVATRFIDNNRSKQVITDLEFQGGLVGYFGYEMKRESLEGYTTPKEQECHCHHDTTITENCCVCVEEPDAAFQFIDRYLVFDQVNRQIYICCLVKKKPLILLDTVGFNQIDEAMTWINTQEMSILNTIEIIRKKKLADELTSLTPISSTCTTPTPSVNMSTTSNMFTPDVEHADYLQTIEKCVDKIKEGESYEICLTTRFRLEFPKHITVETKDPTLWKLYTHYLRKNNPAPFSALLMFPGLGVLSSSPERFLKIDTQHMAEMKPIKGTVARILNCVCKENACDFGIECEENRLKADDIVKQQLWQDVKERAENLMVNTKVVCNKPFSSHLFRNRL